MRKELKPLNQQRMRFTASVERFGTRTAFRGSLLRTILLTDVKKQDGEVVTDHIWFTCGKWCQGLASGDVIHFNARVTLYAKGYFGPKAEKLGEAWSAIDYRLSRPTRIAVEPPQTKHNEAEAKTATTGPSGLSMP